MPKYRLKEKHGAHSMRVKGKMTRLVSGDTIECEPHEIGDGALFKFEPVNASGAVVAPAPPIEDVEPPLYTLEKKHISNGNWVVNRSDTGEPVHDGTMKKAEADQFIAEYNMPDEEEEAASDDPVE